jgi:hypothetical protein
MAEFSSGVAYPVHPIDTVTANIDNNGNIICTSGLHGGGPDEDRE